MPVRFVTVSRAENVATTLRLLCKQGAPLSALEEVLQASLIVYVSDVDACGAFRSLYSNAQMGCPRSAALCCNKPKRRINMQFDCDAR